MIELILLSVVLFKVILLYLAKRGASKLKQHENINHSIDKGFYVIIPVYNETNVIKNCISHWAELIKDTGIKVVLSCSKRENKKSATTEYLARLSINKINSSDIIIVSCPESEDSMAKQINYAIDTLDDWNVIAIYNVDSQCKAKDIIYNFNIVNDDDETIVQQYGLYYSNRSFSFRDIILEYFAYWQSTWAIGFEMANIEFNNIANLAGCKLINRFNYVVGHGMYLSKKVHRKIGPLPIQFFNEDMHYSLIINICGIHIKRGAGWSISSTTNNLSDCLNQQSCWALGPYNAFLYSIKDYKIYGTLLLRIKLFLHYVYWCFGPLFIFTSLAMAGDKMIECICLVYIFLIFSFIPGFINLYLHKKTSLKYLVYSPITLPLVYILHCIGPIKTFYLSITRKRSELFNEYKTEK